MCFYARPLRMPATKSRSNIYARQLGPLLRSIPKSVLAAVAVSLATNGGSDDHAAEFVALEWERLHQADIVPQPLPRAAREFARRGRELEDAE